MGADWYIRALFFKARKRGESKPTCAELYCSKTGVVGESWVTLWMRHEDGSTGHMTLTPEEAVNLADALKRHAGAELPK